jgi:hypothetical protein
MANGPAPGRWTGLGGFAEASREWPNPWEDFHQETDDCRELDNERILALVVYRGCGKRSGLEIEQKAAILFEMSARSRTSASPPSTGSPHS